MTHDWTHQIKGVSEILSAYASGIKSVCYQLPTGGGKSRIIRRIVEHFHGQKKVIYLVTHRRSLINQLAGEMREAGLNFSLVMPGYPMIRTRVRIASLQTIVNRFERLDDPFFIVIDEAHHVASNSYAKIIERWPDVLLFGTTATPARLDGRPLNPPFKKLIIGPPSRELIDCNLLSDYDYYAPEIIDMSGIKVRMGEFAQGESQARVDKKAITGSVIGHYRKHADHQPAIVSCVSIDHCEHVAAQFREAGYRAQAVHSRLDGVDRLIDGLRSGDLEILCQCELLGEGVDIKGASVLIQLRPTMSIVVFLQHIGRVLRFVEGKRAIILDHVGNFERHGLPDDPREWSLDGVDHKDNGVLKYKRCPSCYRVVKKAVSECPFCGHEWTRAEMRLIPEEKEGELINVREHGSDLGLIVSWKETHKKEAIHKMAACAGSLDHARKIAVEYGYQSRFADIVWTKVLHRRA